MSKHFLGDRQEVWDDGVINAHIGNNLWIPFRLDRQTTKKDKANVRLVAAAPEMYEALDEVLAHLDPTEDISVLNKIKLLLSKIDGDEHCASIDKNIYHVPMPDGQVWCATLEGMQELISENKKMRELLTHKQR